MLTSAVLARGRGCTLPPASRPSAPSTAGRATTAAARAAEQSPAGSPRTQRTERAAGQGPAGDKAAGDRPGRSRLPWQAHV